MQTITDADGGIRPARDTGFRMTATAARPVARPKAATYKPRCACVGLFTFHTCADPEVEAKDLQRRIAANRAKRVA